VSPQAPIIELPDIVQSLQNKRWTGTLEILSSDDEPRTTFLFFREGMIQHCAPDRNAIVLGQALYTLGLIDQADYVMTMGSYETSKRRVGEVLVDLGLVDQDGIRQALVYQGREHVLDLFTWERVDVQFHAGEEKLGERFGERQREVNLNLGGMSILMEAARRSDEWGIVKQNIPSEFDVVAPTSPDGLAEGLLDPRITLLVDCYRSAYEVSREAPQDTLDVLMRLGELIQEGHLKLLESSELVQVGLVAEQDGDIEKAFHLYETCTERGLDHLDLHRRIARVNSQLGRKDSLERWLAVAERCVSVDRKDLALDALREAHQLSPNDLELGRRLAALLTEAKAYEEAATVLRPLVDQAEQQSKEDPSLALAVFTEYLELAPEDVEILERASALHLQEDNRLDAMVCLDDMATVLVERGDVEQAIGIYYRVLEIDGENLQARLLLAQNLAGMSRTDDAVREYRRLAEILYRSGVIGNSINWPFLIKVYESIVELEPAATEAWEWLAKAYLENDQNDLAISRYLGMADSLEPSGDDRPPPEILQPLRRVVELDPNNFDVRRRLAKTHLALNQRGRAVTVLRSMAEYQLDAGSIDQAAASYDSALAEDPFDMDSRRGLARIHEHREEHDLAFDAWRAIGGMCHRAGLYDQAVKDFHRAFQIRDNEAVTVRELAQIEAARGRDRNSAMLFARYAHLMIGEENYGSAREALERAAKLEPNLPQVAQLQARLSAAKG
jgi:tetratricopeptide (TPR) repeat protein